MHRLSLVFTLAVLFGCAFSQFDELDTTALDQSAPTGNTAFDSSIVNQPNSPAPEQVPTDYDTGAVTGMTNDVPSPATETFVNTPPTVPATQKGYYGGASQGTATVPATRGNYGGASRGSPTVTATRGNYGGASQGTKSGGTICNPVTGIQARSGSIYAAVLRGAGVQAGNCGQPQGQQTQGQQGGLVNPITGIRARQGGIYETVLRGAGVQAQGQQTQSQQGGLVNPITGIRARQGGIYETVLRGAGVQAQGQSQQGGLVNPITGIRASQGGIYEAVLRGAGVQSGQQQGVGLFGNNALVQAINARGGLVAVGDFDTALPASSSAQAATPGWAVAGIVILVLVLVAIVVVMVQLTILLRRD